jgi:cytochrome c1
MDEETAKAAAAEIDVIDGPNDVGQMFERPGKLSDPLPSPYANGKLFSFAVSFSVRCPRPPPKKRKPLSPPPPPTHTHTLSSFLAPNLFWIPSPLIHTFRPMF